MTRFDANANAIVAPFGATPYLQPYDLHPTQVPLNELNPQLSSLSGIDRAYAVESEHIDFEFADRSNGARMAAIISRSPQGEAP